MNDRQATILVSDDFLVSLTGKFTIIGIYTGDIGIFSDPSPALQLVCLFIVECDIGDPFQKLTFEIQIPGEQEPRRISQTIITPPAIPGRSRWILRIPIPLTNVLLKPGQLRGKVIHEKGEIDVGGPWITLSQR
jgi:hypothetical protein